MIPRQIGQALEKKVTCRVAWDDETLRFYSVDSSSYRIRPLVVVFPKDERDVIKIIRFASRHKIPVTPRGAGTGLVGGSLGHGIILDMRHFNKIKVGTGFVTAGSGVFKGDLDKRLKSHGRFLGPNPSIGPFCTIGGMIGTNASGSHSIKYGSVVDNLISIRMVGHDGRIVSLPSDTRTASKVLKIARLPTMQNFPKVSKNSCGYRIEKIRKASEVQRIIAGSEGTLGIITSAKLRTHAMPRKTVLIIAAYKTVKDAARDVPSITKIGPSAVELVDQNISEQIKERIPKGTRCLLFVEFDDNVSRKARECRDALSGRLIVETKRREQINRWWRHRNSALAQTLRGISKEEMIFSSMEDAAVPVQRMALLLGLLDHLQSRYPLRKVTNGHAGNGNQHTRPILKIKDRSITRKIAREFFSGVINIGGTITGEHGDGLARSGFVKMQYGNDTYSAFVKIKRLFDPQNILNPGKIIVY